MKVCITQYALTDGIKEYESAELSDGRLVIVPSKDGYNLYYHKPNWHVTREEAVARAEQMRTDKIKSLEKQIARIKRIKFEIEE